MKNFYAVQSKSNLNRNALSALMLTLALMACNSSPSPVQVSSPYQKGTSVWHSSVSASGVSSLSSGFLSDQSWENATNNWGPVELDRANGEDGAGDGQKISLSGVQYDKGLGVHADSNISFNLAGTCSRFKASIGLDDEVRNQDEYGNVIFRVFGGDTKLFDSGGMNRDSATKEVDLDVSGVSTLSLVVDQNQNSTEGDRSNWYDHADWANARVECDEPTTPAPTPQAPTPAAPTPAAPTPAIPTPIPTPINNSNNVSTDFLGSDRKITNPERGFYGYGGDLTNISESNLANLAGQYSLVHSYVRLDDYRYSSLDSGLLSQLEEGFAKLRRTGLKAILRFSYNFPDGSNYTYTPDAPLDTVLTHIQQIKPILARNADVVAFWQAGFVGAWGEWHDSTNGLDSAQNKIIIRDALLDAIPNGRFLQVRYPVDLQRWNSNYPTEADAFTNNARIGIYNDCFMADDTDTGTYSDGLNDPLREYTKAVSQVTPFGAETCDVGGNSRRLDCDQIRTEGRDYNLTYLNDNFDVTFMNNWKANYCYDEVERSIGYRFRLNSATHQQSVNRGNNLSLQFNVSNVGWSRLFNPRVLKIVLRNKATGATVSQDISGVDPRNWLPGNNTNVTAYLNIPNQTASGDYDVLIGLPDAAPSLAENARYAIEFANDKNDSRNQAWEADTGLFRIGTTLNIN